MGAELKLVPVVPTEAQWDGLGRALMMAFDMQANTPRKLLDFLGNYCESIPQWLRDEPEMKHLDHTLSKGTRATMVYRAMIEDAPTVDSTPPQAAQGDGFAKSIAATQFESWVAHSPSIGQSRQGAYWAGYQEAQDTAAGLAAIAPPRAEVSEELVEVACRAYYKSIGMNPDDLRRVNTTYEGPVDGQIDMGNYYERGVFKWREKVKVMRDVLTAAMNGGE